MKKFISKLKNKRLKGNVSLLVILILLASSVISLLSINQIQHLISYWNMTFNYFRSFYIAKAWTELGLTELYHSEAWFDHSVNSWDSIIIENLVWIYTWFDPYFNMTISWNFKHLTNDTRYTNECTGDNKITLGTWEWIMLSLFQDVQGDSNSIKNILDNEHTIYPIDDHYDVNFEYPSWTWWNSYFTFSLFDYFNDGVGEDGEIIEWIGDIVARTWDNLNNFSNQMDKLDSDNDRKYLTIKNSWTGNEIVSFCIYNEDNLIPYSDYLVTVKANYWDMEVWLQSVVKNWVPSWALNVLWQQS